MSAISSGLKAFNIGAASQEMTASSYDPDYQAILDRAALEGFALPTQTIIDAGNQLMIDLKTTAPTWWSLMDRIHIWCTSENGFSRIDWKNATANAIAGVIINFTALEGANGMDLNYNPTTDAVNYGINSVSMHLMCLSEFNATPSSDLSAKDGTYESRFTPRRSTGDGYYAVNDEQANRAMGGSAWIGVTKTLATLSYDLDRVGIVAYQAGVEYQSRNRPTSIIPNITFSISENSQLMVMSAVGGSVNVELAEVNTALNTYLTSIGL